MNITNEILKKLNLKTHGLVDVICELVEGSDEIDYHDIADAIKDNPTMMDILEHEFKALNMIKSDDSEINLTAVFKDL